MLPYERLKKIFARISHLQYVQRILRWDEAVMMPEGAGLARAQAIATLNRSTQQMLTSKKIKPLIEAARQASLSPWDSTNVAWMEKEYIRATCVPLALSERVVKATLACEQAWRKLRAQNNWQDFLPYLQQSFTLIKEVAERRSQVLSLSPYDTLLDEYAPGFNQHTIDGIFSELKTHLPPLVQRIIAKQREESIHTPTGPFPVEKQKQLGLHIMQALQFDFAHGRLDESHHPFCSGGPSDVRITTRYDEHAFMSSLFGICHETGHALYEQGLPGKWIDQPIGNVNSMAMHESQSLLIEMEVCRSQSFFAYLTPLLIQQFGPQAAFTPENLYKLATRVAPGFIRVNADEVTYPLHVILRYEIEKKLFNGESGINELPVLWNDFMQSYLGISTDKNHKDGVMQDMHWSAGIFGYFPAYTLGRLIAAQIYAAFVQGETGEGKNSRVGDFKALNGWLKEHVYSRGCSLSVNELLTEITGRPLTTDCFLGHIQQRYLG